LTTSNTGESESEGEGEGEGEGEDDVSGGEGTAGEGAAGEADGAQAQPPSAAAALSAAQEAMQRFLAGGGKKSETKKVKKTGKKTKGSKKRGAKAKAKQGRGADAAASSSEKSRQLASGTGEESTESSGVPRTRHTGGRAQNESPSTAKLRHKGAPATGSGKAVHASGAAAVDGLKPHSSQPHSSRPHSSRPHSSRPKTGTPSGGHGGRPADAARGKVSSRGDPTLGDSRGRRSVHFADSADEGDANANANGRDGTGAEGGRHKVRGAGGRLRRQDSWDELPGGADDVAGGGLTQAPAAWMKELDDSGSDHSAASDREVSVQEAAP
jgi:hypothetical protein